MGIKLTPVHGPIVTVKPVPLYGTCTILSDVQDIVPLTVRTGTTPIVPAGPVAPTALAGSEELNCCVTVLLVLPVDVVTVSTRYRIAVKSIGAEAVVFVSAYVVYAPEASDTTKFPCANSVPVLPGVIVASVMLVFHGLFVRLAVAPEVTQLAKITVVPDEQFDTVQSCLLYVRVGV